MGIISSEILRLWDTTNNFIKSQNEEWINNDIKPIIAIKDRLSQLKITVVVSVNCVLQITFDGGITWNTITNLSAGILFDNDYDVKYTDLINIRTNTIGGTEIILFWVDEYASILSEMSLSGVQGPKGDKGDIGNTGASGSTGAQGVQGAQGLTGADGQQGIQGLKGDTGLTGSQGIQGATGPSGTASLTSAHIFVGNVSNVGTDVSMSGDITIDNTGATAIGSGKVTNTMLAGSIAYSKLAALTSTNIVLGNASNVATSTAVSGDITISNTGVTAIGSGKVTNTMLAGSIAYSNLILTGAILNADLAGSIAYSKLSLTGAILNADLAGSIAPSKITGTAAILGANTFTSAQTLPASGIILGGAGSGLGTLTYANSASSVTLTFPATTGTVALLSQLTDGSTITGIVNAQIASGAVIAFSKLASLTSGNILVGSVGNVATSVAMSGDITIGNTGVTAIGAGKVTNTMLSGSIAYSNLSLTGAILNADLAGSIAKTKISSTGTWANAEIAALPSLGTSPSPARQTVILDSEISTVDASKITTGTLLVARGGTGVTASTGTVAVVLSTTPTLVTPIIGVATGTSLAVTGLLSSSGTAGIGYASGAGGAVTQITSRATGVTINKICGTITGINTSLAASTSAVFIVTNNTVALRDVVLLSHVSGSTTNTSIFVVSAVAAGSFSIRIANISTATADTGTPIINFVVIKAVNA